MTIKVEVFSSPGCSKCGHAVIVLRQLAEEIGSDKIQWREVNILEEMDYAVELGGDLGHRFFCCLSGTTDSYLARYLNTTLIQNCNKETL